jgi:Flp pilus assembly protein TadD
LLLEKVPLLMMGAVSTVLTVLCQIDARAISTINAAPVSDRLANALVAYVRYLRIAVLPVDLCVLYPLHPWQVWQWGTCFFVLIVLTLLALRSGRSFVAIGWLWFLISLIPVLGLFQAGQQSIADRYTYISFVGLSIAVAWTAGEWAAKSHSTKRTVVALATFGLGIAIVANVMQQSFWRNTGTLFTRAVEVTRDNHVAHFNLGLWYDQQGELALAADHYAKAVAIDPTSGEAHQNLGIDLAQLGDPGAAEHHLRTAVQLEPEAAETYFNLGTFLATQGRIDEAIATMEQGIKLNPHDPTSRLQYASILMRRGDRAAARAQLDLAIALDPNDSRAHELTAALADQPTTTPH